MTALHIEAHRAPDDPAALYPVQGLYVERFWLPSLGPTATLLLRLLDQMLEQQPAGSSVGAPLREMGAMVGVSTPQRVRHSIERLTSFARIRSIEHEAIQHVEIPRALSAVPEDRRHRWPAGLAALHDVAAETWAEPLNSTSEQSMDRA